MRLTVKMHISFRLHKDENIQPSTAALTYRKLFKQIKTRTKDRWEK